MLVATGYLKILNCQSKVSKTHQFIRSLVSVQRNWFRRIVDMHYTSQAHLSFSYFQLISGPAEQTTQISI